MSDESDPIAYTALLPGTPVQTSDGQMFGRVERVLVDEKVDVFDGLTVKGDQGLRFLDADYVGAIFTSHVVTTLSAAQAADLPVPDQNRTFGVPASDDSGRSLGDRLRRMFGGG